MESQEKSQQHLRGFAALSVEHRKRIASMGGKAAHEKGTAHQFTSDEAVLAGRKRRKPKKEPTNREGDEVTRSTSDVV